jgi:hypothetical protein
MPSLHRHRLGARPGQPLFSYAPRLPLPWGQWRAALAFGPLSLPPAAAAFCFWAAGCLAVRVSRPLIYSSGAGAGEWGAEASGVPPCLVAVGAGESVPDSKQSKLPTTDNRKAHFKLLYSAPPLLLSQGLSARHTWLLHSRLLFFLARNPSLNGVTVRIIVDGLVVLSSCTCTMMDHPACPGIVACSYSAFQASDTHSTFEQIQGEMRAVLDACPTALCVAIFLLKRQAS